MLSTDKKPTEPYINKLSSLDLLRRHFQFSSGILLTGPLQKAFQSLFEDRQPSQGLRMDRKYFEDPFDFP